MTAQFMTACSMSVCHKIDHYRQVLIIAISTDGWSKQFTASATVDDADSMSESMSLGVTIISFLSLRSLPAIVEELTTVGIPIDITGTPTVP